MNEPWASLRRPDAFAAPAPLARMASFPAPAVLAIDVVAVLAFAAVGRASHGEGSPVLGVLATAWPFLVGVATGWAVSMLLGGTPRAVRAAIPVWVAAVVVGMLLRVATGRGVAVSFVIVATVVLGVFLLGWRALGERVMRRRGPR